VERALREAGLEPGDGLFMQAAMSAFGSFERGADTVLGGIDRVVGPTGVVAMPVFPMAEPAIEYLARDPVFDAMTTPSRMGAVSEAFRRAAGTRRSIHPTHSVAVRGPGADELVAGHEAAETPFGEGTPFARLIERDALQLYFGCGVGVPTMYHSFECTFEPPFPLDVFADRTFDARCVGSRGEELLVHTLVHNPALHPGRIDTNPTLQSRFRASLLERAGARSVVLGRGEIVAIRLRSLLEEFERLLAEGITIYDVRVPDEQPTVPPQARVGV
jgi:aminoglycoside 3-N-acetyltransferase